MDSQEIANAYQEIAFLEQDLLAIQELSEKLVNSDSPDVMIGINVIKEEEEPKTAYVNSTMGMLAIQVNQEQKNETLTWVIDDVSTLRILGVIRESILFQIESIKSEL